MKDCLNCSTELHGKYCHECGQKVIEPQDRTIKNFIYQFFGAAFFLENNFLRNLWTLATKPGQLPLDFIEGRRKRWMSPFSLFLLVNLFYFLYSPLTDLNLSLKEQLHQPHHGNLANHLVSKKISAEGITLEQYSSEYRKKSSSIANSLIVLHLPVFAVFLALFYYRKKYLFVDHFIYAIYLFAFVLLLALIQSVLIYAFVRELGSKVFSVLGFLVFILIIVYLYFSLKKTYEQKTWQALLTIPPVIIAFIVSHFLYRTILFLIVLALT